MNEPRHISRSEALTELRCLEGANVSRAWPGYGSAIFLELGELTETDHFPRGRGEFTVGIEWDWRLESTNQILGGSSCNHAEIDACLRRLVDRRVTATTLEGRIPEMVLEFSNGLLLRSAAMTGGDPQWHISLHDRVLSVESNQLIVAPADWTGKLAAEDPDFEFARETCKRWGHAPPVARLGRCLDCSAFVQLAGEGEFIEYGVCAERASHYDGRVVWADGGCDLFARSN